MEENFVQKVTSLIDEIENYDQVINDATSARTSAELELSEVLTDNENS